MAGLKVRLFEGRLVFGIRRAGKQEKRSKENSEAERGYN